LKKLEQRWGGQLELLGLLFCAKLAVGGPTEENNRQTSPITRKEIK